MVRNELESYSRPFSDGDYSYTRLSRDCQRSIRSVSRPAARQFAAEFGIRLGTLRDWEQERAEPDATARAYLRAIAGNAEAVAKALRSHPRAVAAE